MHNPANDPQIRTAAVQVAMARSEPTESIETVLNRARMVELYIKSGTVPVLNMPSGPRKSPTDAT